MSVRWWSFAAAYNKANVGGERERKSEMKGKKKHFLKLQLSKLVQIQADGFHRK